MSPRSSSGSSSRGSGGRTGRVGIDPAPPCTVRPPTAKRGGAVVVQVHRRGGVGQNVEVGRPRGGLYVLVLLVPLVLLALGNQTVHEEAVRGQGRKHSQTPVRWSPEQRPEGPRRPGNGVVGEPHRARDGEEEVSWRDTARRRQPHIVAATAGVAVVVAVVVSRVDETARRRGGALCTLGEPPCEQRGTLVVCGVGGSEGNMSGGSAV